MKAVDVDIYGKPSESIGRAGATDLTNAEPHNLVKLEQPREKVALKSSDTPTLERAGSVLGANTSGLVSSASNYFP